MMKWSVACLAIAVFLLSGCGPADAPPAPATARPDTASAPDPTADVFMEDETVIVMLGDSLTAGFGLPIDDALPEVVEARLRSDGLPVSVINAGVSGDTTANGLARFDWSVTSADPDILLIALGANDFLRGQPADMVRQNLSAIIERAQTAHIDVILVGLSPRTSDVSEGSAATYAAIYPELADTYDVALFPDMLDGVWDTPALLQADGLHPTSEGVNKVAARLADFLKAYPGLKPTQP